MMTSIWYRIEDKKPEKEGYYLAYKKSSLGDDEEGFGLYYWGLYHKEWRESGAPHSHSIRVSVWSELPEHDPDNYTYHAPSVAEVDAWANVEDAISKFNMIKELSR